jgi:hypothetical protein
VERTLVSDVGHLAEDRKEIGQRLPSEIGSVDHAVGQVAIRAAIGLERVLVAAASGPVCGPVDIDRDLEVPDVAFDAVPTVGPLT